MTEAVLAELKKLIEQFPEVNRLEFTLFDYGYRQAATIEMRDGTKRTVEWPR